MDDRESDPLLIPPPPGKSQGPTDQPVDRVVDAEADTASVPFITLPPGILDSATHRLATARIKRPPIVANRPESSAPSVDGSAPSEVVFFPGPIGFDAEPQGSSVTWKLSIPEGAEPVEVSGALFVGRNPAGTADHPHAQLLAVNDPAKSVSKTHALFETDAGELYVSDLNSTNGVFVHAPGSDEIKVHPGVRRAVPHGSRVELGDFAVEVERAR